MTCMPCDLLNPWIHACRVILGCNERRAKCMLPVIMNISKDNMK